MQRRRDLEAHKLEADIGRKEAYAFARFLTIAAVNSEVVAEPTTDKYAIVRYEATRMMDGNQAMRERSNADTPPMSAVRTVPLLMTSKVALAMLFARLSRL